MASKRPLTSQGKPFPKCPQRRQICGGLPSAIPRALYYCRARRGRNLARRRRERSRVRAALVLHSPIMPRLAPPGPVFGNCRPGVWQYHQLPASSGATCLDGSPYGFFFLDGTPVPKSEPRSMRFNESWLLLFEGGGWCWSPEDCAFRAETKSGSSSDWHHPNKSISIGGLVNKCCFCTRFCRFRPPPASRGSSLPLRLFLWPRILPKRSAARSSRQ